MEELSNWIKGITIAGALAWFLWWKSTIHKEIVKPEVDKINSRIDFLEERTNKLEDSYGRISDNLDKKIDKLQETITTLSKEVAQLAGQIKAMSKCQKTKSLNITLRMNKQDMKPIRNGIKPLNTALLLFYLYNTSCLLLYVFCCSC